ncbi:DegT/DnrJ/EryC1/StrS family aminotransferase [Neobacillus mesonae]|nr:DegT/DnrJ/EryC1/StrS family aminotransferase [Neobacillus mesonae]
MNIPLIDLTKQYQALKKELSEKLLNVLEKGVYIAGPEVKGFESEMAQFTGAKFAVSTANGTDSLILALHACGIGPGDEVITSPFTFFATAEAIARIGAVPVFADIDPYTFNMSPEKAEEKITERTRAIIPVHIFGHPAEMDAFIEIGERYGLQIIEDACQSLGASYKGKQVGSLGHFGCVSFYPTKNLGAYGDAGIVITNNKEMAKKIRILGFHGMSSQKYFHDFVGYNSRLDEIQAAILRIKLKKLQEWNHLRQEKAMKYTEELKELDLTLPVTLEHSSHVFHLYVILSKEREKLAAYLEERGITTGNYYPCPLHLQNAFQYLGYHPGDLPVSEQVSRTALALPLYPELMDEEQDYVIKNIKEFFKK